VWVISGRTNTMTATIPVGSGEGPFGVAADPKTHTIYVINANSGTVSVLAACPK
jgi:DNA-binding beta-propeller fold protein YncE